MNWWIFGGVIVAVVVLGYVAQRLHLIDLSNKSRGGSRGGGIMSIGDEVFAPTRHEAQVEMDRQSLLPAPAPLAGDGDKGIYGGQVVIELPGEKLPGEKLPGEKLQNSEPFVRR